MIRCTVRQGDAPNAAASVIRALAFACAVLVASSCSRGTAPSRPSRSYTDMMGRTLPIPVSVKKVFSTSPMGTILAYSFDPDLVLGWNYAITEADAPFIRAPYRSLPVLGGWFGKTAGANLELLAKRQPDVILSVATSADAFAKDNSERLGESIAVSAVGLTQYGIEGIQGLYEQMGVLTGNQARAKTLSTAARGILERARGIASRVDPATRIRVYYAEGLKGLNTEPAGSIHTQLIEFCGGANVADVREDNLSGYGNTPVSIEQVVMWNPDVILISDYLGKDGGRAGWKDIFSQNPLWSRIKAVREGKVFVVPRTPFQWIDRPPSVNRLAGLIWLPTVLYPELCKYDVAAEIREFYRVFYGSELTADALASLLDTTVRF